MYEYYYKSPGLILKIGYGLSYITGGYFYNKKPVIQRKYSEIGFPIEGQVTFILSQTFGISAGAFGDINAGQMFLGANIGLTVGKIR